MRGRPAKTHVVASRKIWVDADVCSRPVMDILFQTAEARRLVVTLVASRQQQLPGSAYIRSLVVANGFDTASNKIASMMLEGDLVVTSDVPLAQLASKRKASVLDPGSEKPKAVYLQGFASQLDTVLTPPPPVVVAKPVVNQVAVAAPARPDDF